MTKRNGDDSTRGRRRNKRSLVIFVRLFSSAAFVVTVVVGIVVTAIVEANHRPYGQHRILGAQRLVPYARDVTEKTFSKHKFWIPFRRFSEYYREESLESEPILWIAQQQRQRLRLRLQDEGDLLLGGAAREREKEEEDVYSFVLGDASRENVHVVFQELKKRGTSANHKQGRLEVEQEWSGGRRTRSRSLQDAASGFVSIISNNDNITNNPDNETDFNVITGIEYNVSQIDDSLLLEGSNDNNGTHRTTDVSTVVFTESERIKNHSSSTTTHSSSDDKQEELSLRFRPIRVRAYLAERDGGGMFLPDSEHSILLQDIVRPALLSWSAALRVNPVVGNLTVDVNQLVDGSTCGPGRDSGLPSATVPKTHLTLGVANADLIIYLNIGFTDEAYGNDDESQTNSSSNGGRKNSTQPRRGNSTEGEDYKDNSQENVVDHDDDDNDPLSNSLARNNTGGGGGNNSSSSNNNGKRKKPTCSGDYLAASAICSTDQYDRPTAAILHICIGRGFFNAKYLRRNIVTVRHELGHALGFNSWSLAHFRHADGTPITPRVNETGEIPLTEVECSGPLISRRFANVTLPSKEILQFRTVRGGVRVAEVVTPSVVQVVRNHFDCQELHGAELESGEFLPLATDPRESSCIGDHWERRLFKNDLMNAVVEDLEFNPRISTINLAYFADSGWYQVDLSRASPPASWGRASGCDFVEQPCINSDGQVPSRFQDSFCSENPSLDTDGYASDINGCTPDMTKKASCSIEKYDGALPIEYQYFNFTYGSNVGGRDSLMDYCPVYSGFTNGLCTDPENEALIRVDRIERFGERNSRCIPGLVSTRRTALCLRIACAVEDRSFHVQVDGVWTPCSHKDQVLEAANGDRVYCPDPIRVCPTFYCQRDCLGTDLICNYTQGKCVCSNETCTVDEEGEESFYDPLTNSSTSLPDEDSPLSDYYVPTSRELKDESRRFSVATWVFVCTSIAFAVFFCFMAFFYWRRRQAANPSLENGGSDEDNIDGLAATNPNKDKMLATVVVDLRMNYPNLHDDSLRNNRSSETDMSMTDTDGGGTYATDLSVAEFNDRGSVDDSSSLGTSAAREEYFDPLAAPCVVRRRNVHT